MIPQLLDNNAGSPKGAYASRRVLLNNLVRRRQREHAMHDEAGEVERDLARMLRRVHGDEVCGFLLLLFT